MGRRVETLVIGQRSRGRAREDRRAEARLRRVLTAQAREEKRKDRQAERALWEGDYLPQLGETGDHMGRQLFEHKARPTRATTNTTRVLYPFLAEEGLGARGILIGPDRISRNAFCFDPFVLYERGLLQNPNITLLGAVGSGKSSLAKCLSLRAAAFGIRTFIPGDVKGEWSDVVRAVGGNVINVGGASTSRLNPLDEGRRPERDTEGTRVDDELWQRMVSSQRQRLLADLASGLLGRDLSPDAYTALDAALEATAARGGVPLLPTVVSELLEPSTRTHLPMGCRSREQLQTMGWDVGQTLNRLVRGDMHGIFDGPSTVMFDPAAPMLSVSLKAIPQASKVLPLVMTCTSTWMDAAMRGGDLGHRLVIYEEGHRLMSLPGYLSHMRDDFKLARAWGISNLLVMHRLSDLDAVGPAGSKERAEAEGLLADSSTRIVYRQEPDQIDVTRATLRMSGVAGKVVERLTTGAGLWMVGRRSYLVEHQRTSWEAGLTSTDSAMVREVA